MEFLVYTVGPLEENATLEGFGDGVDQEIARLNVLLANMDLERVLEHDSVRALVNDIHYDSQEGTITGEVYKNANPDSALHQAQESGDEVTFPEILSEHEDAFKKGIFGVRRIDGEIRVLIQKNFGSFFSTATKGFSLESHYSAESIKSIQNSETIGKTDLEFHDDFDVTASLFKPPEDGELREDRGFGNTDVLNKFMSIMRISRSHRITLDLNRRQWLENVELFEKLIESNIFATIRVRDTKDNTVKIGKGGDKAIRETIRTTTKGREAVGEALDRLDK